MTARIALTRTLQASVIQTCSCMSDVNAAVAAVATWLQQQIGASGFSCNHLMVSVFMMRQP